MVRDTTSFECPKELVDRLLAGDARARAELCLLVSRWVVARCGRRFPFLSRRGRAEDVAQDVVLDLLRALFASKDPDKLAKLRNIEAFTATVASRAFWRRVQDELDRTGGDDASLLARERARREPDLAEDIEDARRVEACVAALPRAERRAIELRFRDNLGYSEIAADLFGSSTPGNRSKASRVLARAKSLLAAMLRGGGALR